MTVTWEREGSRTAARAGRRRRGWALLVAVAVGAAPLAVQAAPVGGLDATSEALAAAERRLADGDPDGAIALFEAALGRLPAEPGYAPLRAQVLLTIVEAYEAGFARDGDVERLRRARALLDRYLGPLALLDEQGRAAAEDRRVQLLAAIAAVEETLRAEAAARAATARRERVAAARRQGRIFTRNGAALTGLGVAGWVLVGVGLGVGRATDAKLAALRDSRMAAGEDWSAPCTDEACRAARTEALAPLRARGSASNVLVIVGAVTGGALLVAGATLLGLGRKRAREARLLELSPTAAIGSTGLSLGLRGRF